MNQWCSLQMRYISQGQQKVYDSELFLNLYHIDSMVDIIDKYSSLTI